MRALVADDSGVIRSVVKRALLDLGVDAIDEAADGLAAIQAVQVELYDVIVTDWNMPHHTGLDVIKAARSNGQTCPILMQTTESERRFVMLAIAAGVNDYMLKPFTKEVIRDRLARFVVPQVT